MNSPFIEKSMAVPNDHSIYVLYQTITLYIYVLYQTITSGNHHFVCTVPIFLNVVTNWLKYLHGDGEIQSGTCLFTLMKI